MSVILMCVRVMKLSQSPVASLIFNHLLAFAAVALTTVILRPFQPVLAAQLIVLIYLLPVIVSTVAWGLTPGVLAAFLAFLTFNYFFILPYYTFQVHSTLDLITLIIFLIVAVIVSQLIGQAREGVRMTKSREREATRMYELLSALAGLQDAFSIGRVLANHACESFQCERVEVFIEGKNGEKGQTISSTEQPLPGEPLIRKRMETMRGSEGEIRLWLTRQLLSPEENRLLEAYSSQGALALERIRLSKGENKARVLEESDRLKTSLLNSVSHELRSPLAAIKASVSSLRSGAVAWDNPAREELLATIEEETDHLNSLVGNLLDMSRIESGALQPQRRWNAIGEIVNGAASKMRKQLQDHKLVIDLADDLPLVPTDYVMIEQVITNLISNGVKYAPPQSVIRISAVKEADFLHIQVVNQSPPVPEEHLEQIFEKFHRVTEADRVTGTGLGLSICKGIVEAHGGQIRAENQPAGFVFHITLPLTLNGSLPEDAKEAMDGERSADPADR